MRREDDNTLIEDIDDLCVFSEVRYKSKTGRNPPPQPGQEESDFYDSNDEKSSEHGKKRRTGVSSTGDEIQTIKDNFLVGRKFCFAWTDLRGQKKVVYGRVIECEYNLHTKDVVNCKVVYSDQSREMVNAVKNGCGTFVPESQMLRAPLVIGGCLRYEKQNNSFMARLSDYSDLPYHWKWLTPDLRHDELVEGGHGMRLPRLTLALRGFRLVFSVKPSTIPNAGNGVFLSCTPLVDNGEDSDDEQEPFELYAGELIDLGVYAPLRIEDKKLEASFYVKNFVHSFKCEEWAFNSGDRRYELDITDEVTGDLHAIAKSQIYAYVNESDVDERISIQAEHDAEGSVHYLLGHASESKGKFVVPSDGRETEVFVNYGSGYEKVRVRKGYSFLPEDETEEILEELKDEDISDVMEIDSFGEAEIDASVNYLFGLFSAEGQSKFTGSVIERALTCAAVLQRRAQQLFLKGNDDDTEMASTVNIKKVLKLSSSLVNLLLKMARDDHDELKALQAGGNVDELLKQVLERQFSDEQLSKLGDMME